jgi:UDP-2,4-diacetamido-2,4,6-trideoxy-beta-L-altropyranose hydrolase
MRGRRVLFRVDASISIGSGHLMRCLALAEALRAGGAECTFLCRVAGLGVLADRIVAAGHELLPLPESVTAEVSDGPPHAAWLPGGQGRDAAACLSTLLGRQPADWLVVDHYALDRRWQTAMRDVTSSIMVIDDLADRPHDCDLLLDQNLINDMQNRYDGHVPDHCVRLLGPRYSLLREEFVRLGAPPVRTATDAPRLLVMFGGADTQNLTLRAVEQLATIAWPGDVDVVAGPLYGQLEQLKAAVSRLARGYLHASTNSVAALMRCAGLALGSPGVASWERCACALPAITIAQADNQEGIGRTLGEVGAHFYLGRAESVTDDALSAALRAWLANDPARQAMSRAAAAVCDGDGLRRVVAKLIPARLSIRPVCRSDAELLFTWRNDERTRRHALNPKPLLLADHLAWVERTLARTDTDVLLACHDGIPVVCIRFDRAEGRARVSIYTDPNSQGAGYGAAALSSSLEWLRAHHPEITITDADVLPSNSASHALFAAVGYKPTWLRYERSQEAECAC